MNSMVVSSCSLSPPPCCFFLSACERKLSSVFLFLFPLEEEKKEAAPYVDPMSWDGPLVGLARELQQAAAVANEARLSTRLDAKTAFGYTPPPAEGDEVEEGIEEDLDD